MRRQVAEANPDTQVCVAPVQPTQDLLDAGPPNLCFIDVAQHHAGFFTGAPAALATKTGHIGALAGFPFPVLTSAIHGLADVTLHMLNQGVRGEIDPRSFYDFTAYNTPGISAAPLRGPGLLALSATGKAIFEDLEAHVRSGEIQIPDETEGATQIGNEQGAGGRIDPASIGCEPASAAAGGGPNYTPYTEEDYGTEPCAPASGYTLWDEGTGFTYWPGQLVMARRFDPHSAGAQYFFTVTEDAGLLDGQGTYVVFGDVVAGLDVLTDILDSHVNDPDSRFGGVPDPLVIVNTLTIETG